MKNHNINGSKQLIVNSVGYETRVALIENEQLCELFIERNDLTSIVGSIYKGKVSRVLQGMQSAFIDIGLDRSAYLFSNDILSTSKKTVEIEKEINETPQKFSSLKRPSINKLLKSGQNLLVQVVKNSIGTKGARVSTFINLPGRYLIFTPFEPQVGISKKIEDETERTRLKEIVTKLKPNNHCGFLIRTAAEGVDEESIKTDVMFLLSLWESIQQKAHLSDSPNLIHKDYSVLYRVIRDSSAQDLQRIIVDNEQTYKDLFYFLEKFEPKLIDKIELYNSESGIFDAFGIERELNNALEKKVWLKSGGCIIIEQTEALTAIDVNTGRFIGNKSLNDTVLKTNLEAVKEIVLQIRLRNLGGIIILDFIDMNKQEDRDKVFDALNEELKRDKTRTSVLRISDLGLVQMTRQRVESNLREKLCVGCPTCNGKGMIKSAMTMCHEIFRELERTFKKTTFNNFVLEAHHTIIDRLFEEDADYFQNICQIYKKNVVLKSNDLIPIETFIVQKNY